MNYSEASAIVQKYTYLTGRTLYDKRLKAIRVLESIIITPKDKHIEYMSNWLLNKPQEKRFNINDCEVVFIFKAQPLAICTLDTFVRDMENLVV